MCVFSAKSAVGTLAIGGASFAVFLGAFAALREQTSFEKEISRKDAKTPSLAKSKQEHAGYFHHRDTEDHEDTQRSTAKVGLN